MEFEKQYLTYLEYQELEGTLEEMPFNVLEFEARKQIDLRTQRRLVDVEEIPSDVKLCVYHLIDRISSYSNVISSASNSNGNIASENTDGYSISYNQVNVTQIQEIVKSKSKELEDIMLNDLYGVIINNEHIIYNGAN